MGLSPLEDDRGSTLLMGLSPTQSHVKFTTLLMGLSLLGDDCGPTVLMELSPTQSPVKFTTLLMGLLPHLEITVDFLRC